MERTRNWAHRVLVRRWKLLLIALIFLAIVFSLLVAYPPKNEKGVDSAAVAAWIQGVGTVAAVLASAWVARDQFDWQQDAELKRALGMQRTFMVNLIKLKAYCEQIEMGTRTEDAQRRFFSGDARRDDLRRGLRTLDDANSSLATDAVLSGMSEAIRSALVAVIDHVDAAHAAGPHAAELPQRCEQLHGALDVFRQVVQQELTVLSDMIDRGQAALR